MGVVLREWPELRGIRVDLTALSELDEASVASVRRAIETTTAAGVKLWFDGCDARLASLFIANGVDVKHLGSRREAWRESPETLH
jgi:hypothetical protein